MTSDPFSSEKALPSTSSFLEEMHESMSGLLQELFESQHRILTLSEEIPFLPAFRKSSLQIEEEQKQMQIDLKELQILCQNLLQQLGPLFKNKEIPEILPNPPPQNSSHSHLLPLQERLKRTWGSLQKEVSTSAKPGGPVLEVGEMQKWVNVALKQVEKSLDLMQSIPTKCQ